MGRVPIVGRADDRDVPAGRLSGVINDRAEGQGSRVVGLARGGFVGNSFLGHGVQPSCRSSGSTHHNQNVEKHTVLPAGSAHAVKRIGQKFLVGSHGISVPLRSWNFLARIFNYAAGWHRVHFIPSTLILFGSHRKQDAISGRATNLWVEIQHIARPSQNSSQRPLSCKHLRAIMALAPLTVQCMPDSFSRWAITVLQPASTTPDPTNKPCLRKSA